MISFTAEKVVYDREEDLLGYWMALTIVKTMLMTVGTFVALNRSSDRTAFQGRFQTHR